MKPNIHPEYRTVVFHDTSVDEYFKIGSTIKTDREIELDGVTYPYVTIDVSSKSHRSIQEAENSGIRRKCCTVHPTFWSFC